MQQYPQHQQPPVPPKKKRKTGRIVLFTSLGVILWFGACGTGLAIGDSGSSNAASTSAPTVTSTVTAPAPTVTKTGHQSTVTVTETARPTQTHAAKPKPAPANQVIFKVWGTGRVDATYGSDSTNLQGPSTPGWTRKVKLHDDALYYAVTAQLQGSGNVHCSVTIDGQTKKGHASGSYNICSAQLNQGFLGGWS